MGKYHHEGGIKCDNVDPGGMDWPPALPRVTKVVEGPYPRPFADVFLRPNPDWGIVLKYFY